jgi:hypothetical protein
MQRSPGAEGCIRAAQRACGGLPLTRTERSADGLARTAQQHEIHGHVMSAPRWRHNPSHNHCIHQAMRLRCGAARIVYPRQFVGSPSWRLSGCVVSEWMHEDVPKPIVPVRAPAERSKRHLMSEPEYDASWPGLPRPGRAPGADRPKRAPGRPSRDRSPDRASQSHLRRMPSV